MTLAGNSYVRALGHRDYRLLATARTISNTGSWAYNVALVVFVC